MFISNPMKTKYILPFLFFCILIVSACNKEENTAKSNQLPLWNFNITFYMLFPTVDTIEVAGNALIESLGNDSLSLTTSYQIDGDLKFTNINIIAEEDTSKFYLFRVPFLFPFDNSDSIKNYEMILTFDQNNQTDYSYIGEGTFFTYLLPAIPGNYTEGFFQLVSNKQE